MSRPTNRQADRQTETSVSTIRISSLGGKPLGKAIRAAYIQIYDLAVFRVVFCWLGSECSGRVVVSEVEQKGVEKRHLLNRCGRVA